MSDITVLIPTSPIPTHPTTGVIDRTIKSVRDRLPESEIIIMFDGIREEQETRRRAYEEYVRVMLEKTKHDPLITPLVFRDFSHQAIMAREALKLVDTDAILYVEHDTPLIGEINFTDCYHQLLDFHVVRFSHEAVIPDEHWPLMLDTLEDAHVINYPFIRTVQWSQRPHLARTEFYRWILHEYFDGKKKSMIEDKLYGVIYNEYAERGYAAWEKFKLAIYAPEKENLKRSDNLDGRGTDKKYDSEL